MNRGKRRVRSPHPGIVVLRRVLPSGRVAYQARYTDPVTNKTRKPILDPVALSTHEARRQWAIDMSRSLAKKRVQLELNGGDPQAEGKPLSEAIGAYLESAGNRLRGKTLQTYGLAFDRLVEWAEREGIKTTDKLTRARLAKLRDFLIAAPRKAAHRGGRRGERKEAGRKRSPVSVNRELRSLKTLLGAWRVAELLPYADRDAIADTLKALPVSHEQAVFLSPAAVAKLLRAALRHDAAVFSATRDEHAGLRPKGSTRRYDPIAPFTAFLLLTGCRRGEALGLTWSNVDLDALDSHGKVVGEIRLSAANTKTHRARTIGLEVSPMLRALLAAMKLRAGKDAVHVFEMHGGDGPVPYTADLVESTRKRLSEYGAPAFDWQTLRSTCATYLTNAPAIFGAATVFMSARQLGHSVAVAERHYLGVHRGIPKDAHTLEAAMQIEAVMGEVLAAVSGPHVVGSTRREARQEAD